MSLALGEAHSRYTLELNRQHDWGGIFGKDDSTPARWTFDGRTVLCGTESGSCAQGRQSVGLAVVHARVHTSLGARDELLDWACVNWMKEARLGEWNHAEWKLGLAGAQPVEELERIRLATRLGWRRLRG